MRKLRVAWVVGSVCAIGLATWIAAHGFGSGYFLTSRSGAWDLVPWAVGVLALFAAFDRVREIPSLRQPSEGWRNMAGTVAGSAFLAAHEKRSPGTEINSERFAVSVYLARRTWTSPWQQQLLLAERFMFKRRPSSGVRLTKGKGAVGYAWTMGETDGYLGKEYAAWRRSVHWPGLGATFTEAEWQAVAQKDGLTYKEASALKNYEAIFAFPVVRLEGASSRGQFVGVLSVDCDDKDFDAVKDAGDAIMKLANTLADRSVHD